jgi:hypothetical protein
MEIVVFTKGYNSWASASGFETDHPSGYTTTAAALLAHKIT